MHVSPQDQDRADEPAFLVGHSLGGILSLMCAARHPELVRGVLLIDSPVLGGWRATTLGLAKRTALVGALSPGRISQKRRHHWPDAESALESFQQKKSFARWDPQVLRDYIAHGTHDEGGQRVLSFDRDIETAIYNSLPHKLDGLYWWHAVGRNAPSRDRPDPPSRQRPGDDAGRLAPLPYGKTLGHRRRHRGQPAQHGGLTSLGAQAAQLTTPR
jgi:pimeloyl-ACP methyl ester carboxylesterase